MVTIQEYKDTATECADIKLNQRKQNIVVSFPQRRTNYAFFHFSCVYNHSRL